MRRLSGGAASMAVAVGCLSLAAMASHASERSAACPEGAEVPASFAQAAAETRAAVITLRKSGRHDPATRSEDWPDDEWLAVSPEVHSWVGELERLLSPARRRTLGAGVIVDPAGTVLTSAHLVMLGPDLEVLMADGTSPGVRVIGLDQRSDLAVLKLEDGRPSFLPLCPAGRLRQGPGG